MRKANSYSNHGIQMARGKYSTLNFHVTNLLTPTTVSVRGVAGEMRRQRLPVENWDTNMAENVSIFIIITLPRLCNCDGKCFV